MRRIAGVFAAVLIGSVLTVADPAVAAKPATPTPSTAQTLTLITGDVVSLSKAGDKTAATVRPAPGRERITFHTVEADGGLRVLPSDVIPMLSAGRLDADLFDVERLIADGYADSVTRSLPLIVSGGTQSMRTTAERALPALGASAVRADKTGLAAFWQARSAGLRTANDQRIWLDGKVKASLDRSAAQIGAPAAWQAGFDGQGVTVAVLDTGVDATHPDLTGKITETRNFSESPDAVDRFGHGTHVAATVAGTGAGSAGTRKGVAYGAELLIGKVLDDSGSGYESSIIQGMQWAADAGAKVVNMSLGGAATDGTDPMSAAVDEISARTGTLFVVAAGNEGADYSVGTPGAAPSALTVGAVDRDDQLAEFSSRGPRPGDEGLKPEVTAPGVGIVAARAAGTEMGDVVDGLYTGASGTSMATPHVAGAAAILAQQHPDWTGTQLKNALVSTAHTVPGTSVFGQGAGRIDLARAVAQPVTGTGVADFGLHAIGETPSSHTRKLTYANHGTAAVTLTVAVPAELSVSAPSVTVPAGGTATVDVTLDLTKIETGRHTGWITATAPGGVTVTTVFAATYDPPHHKVTVRALDRAGQPTPVPVFTLFGDESRSDVLDWLGTGSQTYEVLEGDYLMHAVLEDGAPLDEQATLIVNPELKVDRDIEVVLDARKGTPIRIETPQPAEQQAVLSYYAHRVTGSGRAIAHGVMHFSTIQQVNVTPTKKLRKGSFEFSSRWQLAAPIVQATIPGVTGPLDINLLGRSASFPGTRRFPLAVWGAADVRGKAVLIPAVEDKDEDTQIAEAAAAGAAVAMTVRPADQSAWTVFNPLAPRTPIPALVVANDDGQKLLARAARPNPSITLTLTTSSPYLYDVFQVSKNRVPDRIAHRVSAANSMRITSRYAANGGVDWAKEQRFGWRPWQEYSWNDTSRAIQTPSVREEWVSTGDSVWQHRVSPEYQWMDGVLQTGLQDVPQTYRKAGRTDESWIAPIVRPATPLGFASTREGDVLKLRVADYVDDSDRHFEVGNVATASLLRDGTLVTDLPNGWQDVPVPAGDAAYELRLRTEKSTAEWTYGTRTDTSWKFRSSAPGALPLLQVDYQVLNHQIKFGLRYGHGAAKPRTTTLTAQISVDGGVTWAALRPTGQGDAYAAPLKTGTSPVSLRVTATDKAGNSVTQTVLRAFPR